MNTPYTCFDQQLIGKQWRHGQDASHTNIDTDPFTGATLAEIPGASQADVDEAYQTASEAQQAWARTAPAVRSRIMHKAAQIMQARAEEIISWLIHESGSTRIKANIELGSAIGITMDAAGYTTRVHGLILPTSTPDKTSHVYREPLGVIGVISPWNFPFHLSMRSVAPALALGNAVVLKPASDTPVAGGLLLAKIFEEAGLPAGLFSVIIGSGRTIGDYFVEHPIPSFISFTGSTAVGKGVGQKAMAGQHLKRVALELGGNAPLVVLDDADIEQAAHAAIVGRFLHQGQICMSTNRVIADEKVHDAFVNALVRRAKALKTGDPALEETVVGPIINAQQLQSVVSKIEQAKKEGAQLLLGGPIEGNLVPPHIFTEVNPEWEIAKDETFGPVLPVIKAKNAEHALALANATEYGLSSAVFTRNLERGLAFARGIRTGMTHINDITVDDQPNAPFGGEKNSGLGRFNGEWIIEEFTRAQWITLQHKSHAYPF